MPDRSALLFPVPTYELDAAGQVLPATYLRWFQEAAIFASAANGFDEARYQELGSTWFVREFHLEIIGSPRPGIAFVVYPLLAAIGGRVREVHWPNWVLAGLIVLRYVLV